MNLTVKQNILDRIEDIYSLSWDDLLFRKHPEENDASKLYFGSFTAPELFALLDRILRQLRIELKEGSWQLMPNGYHAESGLVTLSGEIDMLLTFMTAADFTMVANIANRLAQYQIMFGFWDKTATNRSQTNIEFEDAKNQLKTIQQKVLYSLEDYQNLVKTILEKQAEVERFLEAKKNEFTILTSNQQASTDLYSQIQTLLTNATVNESTIAKQKETCDKLLADIDSLLKSLDQQIIEFKDHSSDEIELVRLTMIEGSQKLDAIGTKLDEIEALRSQVNSKKDEVVKMVNFVADLSMGHSFDSRQRALKRSKTTWMVVSLFIMLLTLVWLSLPAFYPSLLAQYKDPWLNLLSYAGKSAVVFIILGFVIRQYSKERALQEEYAFKTAMALTISAYTDQLSEATDEYKRKIIMDTVERMYTQPRIHGDSNLGFFICVKRTSNESPKKW